MRKEEVLGRIRDIGLIPVLRAESAEQALTVAKAIHAGGLPVLEVTMTVPGCIDVIATLKEEFGEGVLVGAGTILDAESAKRAILKGAQFIVSPVLEMDMIAMCREASVAVFPGGLTPTEVFRAWSAGADAVKVFPASAVGGARYLRALAGPFPQISLIPTGGVSMATAAEFIEAGAFALGVGTELVDHRARREGDTTKIAETARKYVELVRSARQSPVLKNA